MAERRTFLGIETGATHSTALLVDEAGEVLTRLELGPANVRLAGKAEIAQFFRSVRDQTGNPAGIGAGMAGLRHESDKAAVTTLAREVWPVTPMLFAGDLESALEAAGPWPDEASARVLLLSGTGSAAYGKNSEGATAKFGGRGHILGDQGSACDISLAALRAIVYQHDLKARFPALGEAVLRTLMFNHPDDLIVWTQHAEKHEIAHLAMTIFDEAAKGDRLAQEVLRQAAEKLADMAARCAGQLTEERQHVQFVLAGSVLLKQPSFCAAVSKRLHDRWRICRVEKLKRESVWGTVELARTAAGLGTPETAGAIAPQTSVASTPAPSSPDPWVPPISSLATSPTEQRNPRTVNLDTLPIAEAVDLLISENELAVQAVSGQREQIVWLVKKVTESFQSGGRLFYVGAGTSGRLGVLDASECPPTFRAKPEQVQGIIAGGRRAIWSAVEGAEDQYSAGESAIKFRGAKVGDVVLGIAASGRTPYVWGALHGAKQAGATTALLAFHPTLEIDPLHRPDQVILINAGPEPLTGSTRMKSGTATKVVLNILTTLAMVHNGKVISNLMVDLNPSNVKLRDRAVRLVREITGCAVEIAECALEQAGWIVKEAIRIVKGEA